MNHNPVDTRSLSENLVLFEGVCTAGSGSVDQDYLVADTSVRIRFASPTMLAELAPALGHLQSCVSHNPDLTIHAWEQATTGGPDLMANTAPGSVRDGEIWFRNAPGETTAFRPADALLFQLNPENGLAHYWIPDASVLPFDELVAPFRHIMGWWIKHQGMRIVHAAAVGLPDAGLLLVGNNCAGKSTAALSCVEDGMLFAGDNYVVLQPESPARVSTLYCTASLRTPHANNYPGLLEPYRSIETTETGKIAVNLGVECYSQLARDLPIRAVAFPRIGTGKGSSFQAASKADALKAMVSNCITHLNGRDPEALRVLADLVRNLPTFQLNLGSDLRDIPRAVRMLLHDVKDGRQ